MTSLVLLFLFHYQIKKYFAPKHFSVLRCYDFPNLESNACTLYYWFHPRLGTTTQATADGPPLDYPTGVKILRCEFYPRSDPYYVAGIPLSEPPLMFR